MQTTASEPDWAAAGEGGGGEGEGDGQQAPDRAAVLSQQYGAASRRMGRSARRLRGVTGNATL